MAVGIVLAILVVAFVGWLSRGAFRSIRTGRYPAGCEDSGGAAFAPRAGHRRRNRADAAHRRRGGVGMRETAFAIALALPFLVPQGRVRADDGWAAVPAAMQGVWGRTARCDVEDDRSRLTGRSAAFESDVPRPVHHSPEENAVHRVEEPEVDNIVPGVNADFLVCNSEGFDMPGQIGYERRGTNLARLPWPFKAGPVKAPN